MGGPGSPLDQALRAIAGACEITWTGRQRGGRSRVLFALLCLAGLWAIQGAGPADVHAASSQVTFSVSGEAASPLYPGGPAQPLPLTLRNPMSQTIYITQVSAGVNDTSASGCDPAWFTTTALNVPGRGIAVPPHGSVSLAEAGRGQPTIRMRDSGTNQDLCRNAKLALTYSGTTRPAAAGHAVSPSGSGNGGGSLPFTGFALLSLALIGGLLALAGLAFRREPRR
jgi:hypothetical protein